jgi:imidazole glycerol-phosphate synthase subunit HisF
VLIPRVIPVLLLDDDQFVKTTRYENPTYLGDPVNVINLFNRFEVDEIVLLDIRATVRKTPPSMGLLRELASECWVPLTYGGGITTVDQVGEILSAGVEKVVFGTSFVDRADVVEAAARKFGSQAVVVAVDVRGRQGNWTVVVESASRKVDDDPVAYARRAQDIGVGEILLTAVDREGAMLGFDTDLIRLVSAAVGVPLVAHGGARRREDLAEPIRCGASAVAAGSIFVFQGIERGVLINFPKRADLEQLMLG